MCCDMNHVWFDLAHVRLYNNLSIWCQLLRNTNYFSYFFQKHYPWLSIESIYIRNFNRFSFKYSMVAPPTNTDAPIVNQCKAWIQETTLFVTRYEYANLYHTLTDWFNVYQVWTCAHVRTLFVTCSVYANICHAFTNFRRMGETHSRTYYRTMFGSCCRFSKNPIEITFFLNVTVTMLRTHIHTSK